MPRPKRTRETNDALDHLVTTNGAAALLGVDRRLVLHFCRYSHRTKIPRERLATMTVFRIHELTHWANEIGRPRGWLPELENTDSHNGPGT